MKDIFKESDQEKNLFRSYYCGECKQKKSCGTFDKEYCCLCYYQQEKEKAREYNNYQQKIREKQTKDKQLQLLKNYLGCKQCGSKEVDAYNLYENSSLVCQSCRMKKEGGSSSPISFTEQQKWYKKRWKINLNEWLEKFSQLPVNASCARKWLKDKGHLNNCECLEKEAKEINQLFTNSLKEIEQKLKECACKTNQKVRADSDYYTWCEICEKTILVASKKRVIKNRNDPQFWGLKVREKVLCGECLESKKGEMKPLRRAKFNEYRRLGRL